MNYQEAIDFLYTSLPMFQRTGKAAYKANLDNTHRLDALLGHPHRHFRSVHIAGTNGKGSVSHMLASIFQEAGYRTGLYTSPHLLDFRERIRINGKMIGEEAVIDFVEKVREEALDIQPSFFEITVAMAFQYFAGEAVDIAIIETGMGGRLDSTNIIQPDLSVITNISLDHTAFLGDTEEKIAAEKAGIIKNGIPCVSGVKHPGADSVIEQVAQERSAPLFRSHQERIFQFQTLLPDEKTMFYFENSRGEKLAVRTDLAGAYQADNIGVVLSAVDRLRGSGKARRNEVAGKHKLDWNLPEQTVAAGLEKVKENTGLRGRWETLGANPRVICDNAHNPAGVAAVVEQIRNTPAANLHIVWGMVSDKSAGDILSLLPAEAQYYFCRADIPRAMPVEMLAEEAAGAGLTGRTCASVKEAYLAARAAALPDDLIFIGGSTFVVADLLKEF